MNQCAGGCVIFFAGGIGGNLGAGCSVVIVTVKAKSADANLAIRRWRATQVLITTARQLSKASFFQHLGNFAVHIENHNNVIEIIVFFGGDVPFRNQV